jgi:hypothetical protein
MQARIEAMMGSFGSMGGGMWGMGFFGVLIFVVLILGIAALIKYRRN